MKNVFKNNSLASCLLGIIIGAAGHAGYTAVFDAYNSSSSFASQISAFASMPQSDAKELSTFDKIPEDEDGDCIITPSGQKYHNIYGCMYLSKSKRMKRAAIENAEAAGLEPCSKCW